MIKTNYSKIAATYNNRYSAEYLVNIETEIYNLISLNNYSEILEAGCGTGRWVKSLYNNVSNVFGLDYSLDMLKIARSDNPKLNNVNADAVNIPFKDSSFDLIFCVNAIHHFPDKNKFICESRRILSNGGTLAVFGVDPHIDKDWYVYDFFDSVYENDLNRFPSLKFLKQLFADANFVDLEIKIAEKIYNERIGNDVLNDPFLNKNHSSQLANLSNDEYEKGIEKIKNKILEKLKTVFTTSVIFYLVSAKKGI
jgi:ubiquinone/menaquinone biosynthesis C-methylase UbiE